MLDTDIREQLEGYMQYLEHDVQITLSVGTDADSTEMKEFIMDVAALSPKLSVAEGKLERTPCFSLGRKDGTSRVFFAGTPFGHEFNSFILALIQVSGHPPKEEAELLEQAKNLQGEYHFETYVSLSCQNCPDVVQALNLLSILNPNVTHTMIDGVIFRKEAEGKGIRNVPSVYLNGKHFSTGRMGLKEFMEKLSGVSDISQLENKAAFDVLIIGGGPAGSSAAIYAARKGIRTGILAEQFGGQLKDTVGIENFISVNYIEGADLSAHLESHVKAYDVDVMKSQLAKGIEKRDGVFEVPLESGAVIKSRTVIVATGAGWRHVNVPGEERLQTKGVAYCPHCDGPLYKGREVAVIGGGNSGIEAAIDLAGIAKHVTVLEFLPELKADAVLQEKLKSLDNVTVFTNVETKEITGKDEVDGITYKHRETGEESHIGLKGVFVQIGLVPNTSWLADTLEKNNRGEIVVNSRNETNLPGVFAAGDCTDSPYKQIIISMGSGATAALSAFDYLIRNPS